jgi:hypothetical protein
MGLFEDFGESIVAEKREAFKAAISALDGAVKIDSREAVEKLAESNAFIKSWKDSVISTAVASHDAKFMKDSFPDLVEAEIKKRGPKPKDPELAAALERVEALETAKAKAEAENVRINQRSKVLPVLTELGLDAKWADRLIGASDAETDELVKAFKADFGKARDGYTEKLIKDRFGNQGMPPAGGAPAPQDMKSKLAAAEAKFADAQKKNDRVAMAAAADEVFAWSEAISAAPNKGM